MGSKGSATNARQLAVVYVLCLIVALALSACGGAQPGSSQSDTTGGASQGSPDVSDVSSQGAAQGAGQPAGGGSGASDAVQPGSAGSTGDVATDVQAKLSSMTLEEKVAQMFIARGESLCSDGSSLVVVDDDVRANLASCPVGGVALLEDSLIDPDQATALASGLQDASHEASGLDLLLCVDEEGGIVSRIGANPQFPETDPGNMRAIGDAGDTQAAYDVAEGIGSYLLKYGYNVDFAPVCDVDNPSGGTMYERSFGSSASVVAQMVEAQVKGFNDAGVLSCAKHFPGIGSAAGDSHDSSITTNKNFEQMREEDLVPFQAAIDAGVPMVMVGHISCPNVTGDTIPATFSPSIITGILRKEMGFDGVVVTDSLGMGAATAVYSDADAAVRAVMAGADMLLMPSDLSECYQAVLSAVQEGRITDDRIDESVVRILKMKYTYANAAGDSLPLAEAA